MAITLTGDPIVTEQECRDVMGWNDEPRTTVLINAVSAKFLKYTNRVRINQGTVEELTRAVDGRLVWAHAAPIASGEVKIEIEDELGEVQASYTTTAGELVVDRTKGRIALPGCVPFPSFCSCGVAPYSDAVPSGEGRGGRAEEIPFPNLTLTYTGGWVTIPGDLVMSAFEQLKLDMERLKGTTAMLANSTFQEVVAFESEDLAKSVLSVWKRYRILL